MGKKRKAASTQQKARGVKFKAQILKLKKDMPAPYRATLSYGPISEGAAARASQYAELTIQFKTRKPTITDGLFIDAEMLWAQAGGIMAAIEKSDFSPSERTLIVSEISLAYQWACNYLSALARIAGTGGSAILACKSVRLNDNRTGVEDDKVRRGEEAFAKLQLAREAARAQPASRQEEELEPDPRNKYCYDCRAAGQSLQAIKNAVNARDDEWEPIDSLQGISQAAKRYAELFNKPWPIKRFKR